MGEQVYEGACDGRGRRFAVAVARFNQGVTGRLLEGAIETLVARGAAREDILVAHVPGSFELPVALARLAATGRFHALIALGCVIRGETPHFEHVARSAIDGCEAVARSSGLPVALGVLTCETAAQAEDRVGGKAGHKGKEAALAALEMADLFARLDRREPGRPDGADSAPNSATPEHAGPARRAKRG